MNMQTTEEPKSIANMPPSGNLPRRGSFTEIEKFFLKQLLLGDDDTKPCQENNATTKKTLDDTILFSVPPDLTQGDQSAWNPSTAPSKLPPSHQKAKRYSTVDLWKAHADGVSPSTLKQKGSLVRKFSKEESFHIQEIETKDEEDCSNKKNDAQNSTANPRINLRCRQESHTERGEDDASDVASDVEVRPEKDFDNVSVASSWDDTERHHFDAWEVLRDEYAADFGFDYSTRNISLDAILNEEENGNTFQILGTSAKDKNSQPHVLSPPLMDALMNFLPTDVVGQNYWMRYSLVRDGASLETLKQYVRAAKYTIMAVETRNGTVFGSFTSSPWRTNLGFFGKEPSFVWKMRHSRRSKCASLFDQAQLESEIDIFNCQGSGQYVQMCRHNAMAVGGDDGALPSEDQFNVPAAMEDVEAGGFAIALEEDLMCGTTSPSKTFESPALYGPGDKTAVFDVAGLEIWSFTPCMDVKSAEKLEMTKYFIEESTRGSSRSDKSSERSFSSMDLVQERFYRRVGDDLESEERRQRWQYANMMGATDGVNRGLGATPRFVS